MSQSPHTHIQRRPLVGWPFQVLSLPRRAHWPCNQTTSLRDLSGLSARDAVLLLGKELCFWGPREALSGGQGRGPVRHRLPRQTGPGAGLILGLVTASSHKALHIRARERWHHGHCSTKGSLRTYFHSSTSTGSPSPGLQGAQRRPRACSHIGAFGFSYAEAQTGQTTSLGSCPQPLSPRSGCQPFRKACPGLEAHTVRFCCGCSLPAPKVPLSAPLKSPLQACCCSASLQASHAPRHMGQAGPPADLSVVWCLQAGQRPVTNVDLTRATLASNENETSLPENQTATKGKFSFAKRMFPCFKSRKCKLSFQSSISHVVIWGTVGTKPNRLRFKILSFKTQPFK